jgi:hypothetical protein
VRGWDPDVPAPTGYRLASDPNGKLIGVGVALLSIGWTSSAVAAAVGASLEDGASRGEFVTVKPEDWAILYVPVAGPAVAIGTLRPPPSAVGLLLADTIVQLGGLVGIVAGALDVQYKVVRTELGVALELGPHVGSHDGGWRLNGTF